jgi:RNA polymerase sigma factor (sigma-70 family)
MSPDAEKPSSPLTGEAAKARADGVSELFLVESGRLRRWLRRKTPRDAADEIADQAFTNLLATDTRTITNLRAFLYRIAHNLMVNYHRDKQRRRDKLVLLKPEESQTAPPLESSLMDEDRRKLLKKALDGLPPRCRMVLQLRLFEDLSDTEIVARLAERGLTVKEHTVRRYLVRGYEICRQALEASEEPKQERSE